VPKVPQELKDTQVLKVTQDLREHKVIQVLKVT
jgi:hypothetical protein